MGKRWRPTNEQKRCGPFVKKVKSERRPLVDLILHLTTACLSLWLHHLVQHTLRNLESDTRIALCFESADVPLLAKVFIHTSPCFQFAHSSPCPTSQSLCTHSLYCWAHIPLKRVEHKLHACVVDFDVDGKAMLAWHLGARPSRVASALLSF